MKRLTLVLVTLIGVVALPACAPVQVPGTSEAAVMVRLTPYHTATLTPSITPTPEGLPTSTPAPTVTPTPRVYTVQSGDTLGGIARYFGVTLDELQAANLGVRAELLSIGAELVIPGVAATPAAVSASPTISLAVTLKAPNCVQSLTGGYHCFALVVNGEDFVLENLMAEISLSNSAGEETITRQVLLPLNQLEAGASLPFYTYFAPPTYADVKASAVILTVTKANTEDGKVIPLVIEEGEVMIAADGISATVNGTAKLEERGPATGSYTLVAVAYDVEGRVIGLRRITEESGWGDSDVIEFSITVYSTGGSIDRVEVFGEAE